MADLTSDGAPYGQFGGAVYLKDNAEWQFARSMHDQVVLQPISAAKTVAEATATAPAQSNAREYPSRRREKQAKALVQANPELQPALDLLPELASVSEAVENAVSRCSTHQGQLLAFGQIYDESRRGYVAGIAFPCGPNGSQVRIIQGLEQRQGWDERRTNWIKVSDFTGEEATWQGPGVCVLSIIFAEPIESGERYLAVRLHAETLVFRPILRKSAPSARSRLDPNFLFAIRIDETGGFPHSDVSFNPWFTGQLAIVDQAGNWSIWETGRRSSAIRKIKAGSLVEDTGEQNVRTLEDGWLRIAWVESASTVCIAFRHRLVLIDVEAASSTAGSELDLGLKGALGWILDLASVENHMDHVLILTSSQVCLTRIERCSSAEWSQHRIATIRHHRSPEDTSLRMSISSSGDSILLVLRSAISAIINEITFKLSSSNPPQVPLPKDFLHPSECDARDALDLCIRPLKMLRSDDTNGSPDSEFFQVYFLGRDLQLLRSLYATQDVCRQGAVSGTPAWTVDVSRPGNKSKAALGGFILNEDETAAPTVKAPESAYARRRRDCIINASGIDWTVSYEHVVQLLEKEPERTPVDLDDVIEEALRLLQGPNLAPKAIHTLRELGEGTVDTEDLDGASERLEGLPSVHAHSQVIKTEGGDFDADSQGLIIRLVPAVSEHASCSLGVDHLDSLRSGLDAVDHAWIKPFTNNQPAVGVPGRKVLAKCMAIEVVLAKQILRVEDGGLGQGDETQTQSQAWELPVRPPPVDHPSQDAKSSNYGGSSRAHTPALPTPSESASIVTGSSRAVNLAAPEVARLTKYATFSREAPSALPRALNKVLSHWDVGADPVEYDWQRTARHVSRRDEEADEEGLTEKERRQMQRRTDRYIRRQRREAEESQRQQMLSSQAPEIVSASQPAVQRPGVRKAESQVSAGAMPGSSQSFGLSQMVASQVVPGRHGGRPPKKKRKSGF